MYLRVFAVDNTRVGGPDLVPEVALQRYVGRADVQVLEAQPRVQPDLAVHDVQFKITRNFRDPRNALKVRSLVLPFFDFSDLDFVHQFGNYSLM